MDPTTIDVSVLEFLRSEGLEEQVLKIEKQFGINLGDIARSLDKFITVDPACLTMKKHAQALAVHEDAVLIQGETGTGKEIIARVLSSNRKNGNFVAINVAAIPRELLESTLFGYSKGAFTGASIEKQGLIQFAGEGTLFLDEIGDLSSDLQAKFLRVLQDRKVRRVGGLEEEEVKCRFITASHHTLATLIPDRFRIDLYARLSTFVLTIPPLRDRLCDIPLLMKQFDPKFPVDKVDWHKIDLKLNVRSLQQYARRFAVLKTLPE